MPKEEYLNHHEEHDIYFHLNPSIDTPLKPRDIFKIEGKFEKYNDQVIKLIKDKIKYKGRTFAKLNDAEIEELEKSSLYLEIKNDLKSISGIKSENGCADGFRVNVYHPGVGFREHSDGTKTDHYFPCEEKQDYFKTEDEIPEKSAITAAVCFGSRRTVMFKYNTDRATISRPEYYLKYFPDGKDPTVPLYPLGLDLKGGDYYAFSRGFRFKKGELTMKGINSTHKHCVLAHPKFGIETEEEDIHVSFVMFGCTSVTKSGNGK